MSDAHSTVAHHFDDAAQQRDASTLGMWFFLVTEIMFFGGLFTAYIIYRRAAGAAFAAASSHLDVVLGAINTAVLIGSSLTMALAVQGSQRGRRRAVIVFLILTILLGGTFLAIKGVEYSHKFHEHLMPGSGFQFHDHPDLARGAEVFFSLYFAMTGMHALHMVIGIGLLTMLIIQTRRGRYSAAYFNPVENVGLYWHFVDIVWIFLFPLLYLLGRH